MLRDRVLGTSKNYVFRGGGVGRSPTHSPFAFRRKAKGEVFRGALLLFAGRQEIPDPGRCHPESAVVGPDY